MKLDSCWTDSAPAFQPSLAEFPATADVVIVGAGFLSFAAARALAKRDSKMVVLEARDRETNEASSRIGGHVNNSLAVDHLAALGPGRLSPTTWSRHGSLPPWVCIAAARTWCPEFATWL